MMKVLKPLSLFLFIAFLTGGCRSTLEHRADPTGTAISTTDEPAGLRYRTQRRAIVTLVIVSNEPKADPMALRDTRTRRTYIASQALDLPDDRYIYTVNYEGSLLFTRHLALAFNADGTLKDASVVTTSELKDIAAGAAAVAGAIADIPIKKLEYETKLVEQETALEKARAVIEEERKASPEKDPAIQAFEEKASRLKAELEALKLRVEVEKQRKEFDELTEHQD